MSIFVENRLANFFFFNLVTRLPRPLQATWNRYNLKVCQILLDRGADLLWQCFGGLLSTKQTQAILEERREALRVAFAEGPHESQIQWRRDDCWARRWPTLCWC